VFAPCMGGAGPSCIMLHASPRKQRPIGQYLHTVLVSFSASSRFEPDDVPAKRISSIGQSWSVCW
jgi:hypothetical protein